MYCECLKPGKKSVKGIGIVINPWPYQERTFYGHVFALKDSVKPPEKGQGLVVVNRCQIA